MNRVLVVEDNPNNMKLINMVLKRHGYETIGAVTGEEGVEKAGTEKPDMILMDIMLPDIDGLETTRRIRRIESLEKIPIIAITSYAMAGDREKILQAGCNGYFEKPINPLTIMNDIEKIIERMQS
ncbi:response regulator with CheY-like receiver domain and winged-helix DNA-binding domain [Methanolobus tindarius DSM 2278]|jgi:CheY-like chemotaxis protein|uniref:Response regulator with CheY-like receiver domain and winged-helix DNA-binding domain n=1 Tax=Methanolobus tindarius DSM 2278 TaxID=1090322 RepID=W9DQ59_METTI|nr:response regulator [Methanolobus tindarius]ETA67415.1 response regulator with CheY-like receiver domain and winged-helix DNA-binding domain [Methanolobus tindarius DSM 2278]